MTPQHILYHVHRNRVKELKEENTKIQLKYDDLEAYTEKAETAINEIFKIIESPFFLDTKMEKIKAIINPFFESETVQNNERKSNRYVPIW